MASLIKVDEMEANTAPLMKFNTGAYNLAEPLTVTGGSGVTTRTGWDAEASPVVKMPDSSATLIVSPNAPTVAGMYMTIIYPVGPVYAMSGGFDTDTVETPAPSDTEEHRVYYSSGLHWKDA